VSITKILQNSFWRVDINMPTHNVRPNKPKTSFK